MQQAPHQSEVGYRADIDGLRALAVGAVCAFHAAPNLIRGGYVGVDVFFVISGFLISGIILRARDRGTFSFSTFYLRRIRRIFPALIVVLSAVLLIGWLLLLPAEYESLGRHMLAASAFGSNFLLWKEAGYFDTEATTKPLLHLWSLGIEEQFYLVWPAALVLFKARGWKLQAGIAVIAVVSFVANVAYVRADPSATFYSPLTRFWELLIGALLATMVVGGDGMSPIGRMARKASPAVQRAACEVASVAGVAMILWSIFRFGRDTPFPGWFALAPTVGTALIIGAGPAAALNRWILAHPVAVFIGLVSYPLYLWHWPLLVFQAGSLGHDTKTILIAKALALLLAFGLSVATYRFVELPIRDWSLRRVARVLPAIMVAVAVLGFGPLVTDGVPGRLPAFASEKPDTLWHREVRESDCVLKDAASVRSPICIETRRPLVFLWGDSHAAALYPGLKTLQEPRGFGIGQLTQYACPPYLVGAPVALRPDCNDVNHEVLLQARRAHPDVFLLHASWKHNAYGMGLDEIATGLKRTTDSLRKEFPRARIIVLGPVPHWKISLQRSMFLYWRTHHETPPQYMRFMLLDGIEEIDLGLGLKARELGFEYISVYDMLCNERGCRTANGQQGENPTAIDYGHLTRSAAAFVAARLDTLIFGSRQP